MIIPCIRNLIIGQAQRATRATLNQHTPEIPLIANRLGADCRDRQINSIPKNRNHRSGQLRDDRRHRDDDCGAGLLADCVGNHNIIAPQICRRQLGQAKTAAGCPVNQFTPVTPFVTDRLRSRCDHVHCKVVAKRDLPPFWLSDNTHRLNNRQLHGIRHHIALGIADRDRVIARSRQGCISQ